MTLNDDMSSQPTMRIVGTRGCRSVLQDLNLWRNGMRLKESRELLWKWPEVQGQMSRIEQLCQSNGIVLMYEPKAHPVFNPTEV